MGRSRCGACAMRCTEERPDSARSDMARRQSVGPSRAAPANLDVGGRALRAEKYQLQCVEQERSAFEHEVYRKRGLSQLGVRWCRVVGAGLGARFGRRRGQLVHGTTLAHSGQLASLRSSRNTSSSLASASTSLTLSDAAEYLPESLGARAAGPGAAQSRRRCAEGADRRQRQAAVRRLPRGRSRHRRAARRPSEWRGSTKPCASRHATRPQSRRCSRRTSDKRDTPGSRRSRGPTSRIPRSAVFSAPTETL